MIHEKIIFIIPGFKHQSRNKAYKDIAEIFIKQGYSPILVNIPWKKSTISENTKYFLEIFREIKARKKYILGFSYGAMIAFIASTKVKSSGLILCSLSPYFKEDVLKTKNKVLSSLMRKRYEDFSKLHCGTLAKKIKAEKILMLYGAEEAKVLVKRVTDAFDKISSKQKHLIKILKTEHEIGNRRYLYTIHQVTRELL